MRLASGEYLELLGKKMVFVDRVVEPWPSNELKGKQKTDGDAWNAKFIKLLLKWGLLEPEVFVAVGVRPGPRQPRSLTIPSCIITLLGGANHRRWRTSSPSSPALRASASSMCTMRCTRPPTPVRRPPPSLSPPPRFRHCSNSRARALQAPLPLARLLRLGRHHPQQGRGLLRRAGVHGLLQEGQRAGWHGRLLRPLPQDGRPDCRGGRRPPRPGSVARDGGEVPGACATLWRSSPARDLAEISQDPPCFFRCFESSCRLGRSHLRTRTTSRSGRDATPTDAGTRSTRTNVGRKWHQCLQHREQQDLEYLSIFCLRQRRTAPWVAELCMRSAAPSAPRLATERTLARPLGRSGSRAQRPRFEGTRREKRRRGCSARGAPRVENLAALGYPREQARVALARCSGSPRARLNAALDLLLEQ